MADCIALMKQAQQAQRRGDIDAAEAMFAQAAEHAPQDPRPLIQRLRLLTEARRMDQAAALDVVLTERFEDHPVALLFRGKYRFAASDWSAAGEHFARCLALQPSNPLARCYSELVHWLQDQPGALQRLIGDPLPGNTDFSCDFCMTAELRLMRDFPETAEGAGETNGTIADETSSDANVVDAGSESAGNSRLATKYFKLAQKASHKDDYAQCLDFLAQALEADPKHCEALFGKAETLFTLHRFAEAAAAYEQALELRDNPLVREEVPFHRSMYGCALTRSGQLERAWSVLREVRPFGPDDFMGHYYRGVCLIAMNRETEGRAQMRAAFEQFELNTREDCLARLMRELKERYKDPSSVAK
ncbi:tetratricopeptide repeat protein [Candidatus Sumerlaeota bacterium]|nr:tetratricopeptide repeat protein [Candidatus Sumerlaeota bacterium]